MLNCTYRWQFFDFFIRCSERCQSNFLRKLCKTWISQQWHVTQEFMNTIAEWEKKGEEKKSIHLMLILNGEKNDSFQECIFFPELTSICCNGRIWYRYWTWDLDNVVYGTQSSVMSLINPIMAWITMLKIACLLLHRKFHQGNIKRLKWIIIAPFFIFIRLAKNEIFASQPLFRKRWVGCFWYSALCRTNESMTHQQYYFSIVKLYVSVKWTKDEIFPFPCHLFEGRKREREREWEGLCCHSLRDNWITWMMWRVSIFNEKFPFTSHFTGEHWTMPKYVCSSSKWHYHLNWIISIESFSCPIYFIASKLRNCIRYCAHRLIDFYFPNVRISFWTKNTTIINQNIEN